MTVEELKKTLIEKAIPDDATVFKRFDKLVFRWTINEYTVKVVFVNLPDYLYDL